MPKSGIRRTLIGAPDAFSATRPIGPFPHPGSLPSFFAALQTEHDLGGANNSFVHCLENGVNFRGGSKFEPLAPTGPLAPDGRARGRVTLLRAG
jgi:hypothetical protein